MRKKKAISYDRICKECDDLRYMLENESRGSTDDRYKKIVLSILPVLLVRIDTIGTILCILLGAFLAHLIKF